MSYQALDHNRAKRLADAEAASAIWAGLADLPSVSCPLTLIDEAKGAFESDRSRARQCLERALDLLKRGAHSAPAAGGLAKWQIARVQAYIDEHIAQQIRVTDLAAIARLSAGHFSRRFRASFGERPLVHVARRRVEFAQGLMINSRSPLALLALDAGFCDQAHFTRVFKKTTGASPRAWLRTRSVEQMELAA